MIYHSSDCLSDWNQLEPLGSDRKLVGNNSEWSDQNPVGQIGQISYYLGGTVFQKFWSDSDRNPSGSAWFRSENVEHIQDLEYTWQRMRNMIPASYQPFTKGQKVWLEGQNLSLSYNKKITTKREGPFLITEVIGPVNYRLKLPDKWKQWNTFHASLLTPYKENNVHGPNYTQSPDLIDGQEEWEVEHNNSNIERFVPKREHGELNSKSNGKGMKI